MALRCNEIMIYGGSYALLGLAMHWLSGPTKPATVEFPSYQNTPVAKAVYALETAPSTCYLDKFGDLELSSILSSVQYGRTEQKRAYTTNISATDSDNKPTISDRFSKFKVHDIFEFVFWEDLSSDIGSFFLAFLSMVFSTGIEILKAIPLLLILEWVNEWLKKPGVAFIDGIILLGYFVLRYFRREIHKSIVAFFKDHLLDSFRKEFVAMEEHNRVKERLDNAIAFIEEECKGLDEIASLRISFNKFRQEFTELQDDVHYQNDLTRERLTSLANDIQRIQDRQDDLSNSLSTNINSCNKTVSSALENYNELLETLRDISSSVQELKNQTLPALLSHTDEKTSKLEIDIQTLKIKLSTLRSSSPAQAQAHAARSTPPTPPPPPPPAVVVTPPTPALIPECPHSATITTLSQKLRALEKQSAKHYQVLCTMSPSSCIHTPTISILMADRAALNTLLRSYATRNIALKSAFEQQLAGIDKEDLPGNVGALMRYVQSEFGHVAERSVRSGGGGAGAGSGPVLTLRHGGAAGGGGGGGGGEGMGSPGGLGESGFARR